MIAEDICFAAFISLSGSSLRRFGLEAIDYTERTCIIVVGITGPSGTVLMGIVVDSVSEVSSIKSEDIEDTPTFGVKLDTDYILGMAKVEVGSRSCSTLKGY